MSSNKDVATLFYWAELCFSNIEFPQHSVSGRVLGLRTLAASQKNLLLLLFSGMVKHVLYWSTISVLSFLAVTADIMFMTLHMMSLHPILVNPLHKEHLEGNFQTWHKLANRFTSNQG